MNKQNISIGLIAFAIVFYLYTTNEKTKIKKVFSKIETIATQDTPPPPLKLALKVSTLLELIHQNFNLIYEQKDVFFEVKGKQELKPYLPMAITRTKDFELQIDISEIVINDDKAFVKLKAWAKGKVIDYSDMFSEQREFRIQMLKKRSKWLIANIENIENESMNY